MLVSGRGALALALAIVALPVRPQGPASLRPVVQRGKWGYIDVAGRVIVAPRFDRADAFSDGLAAVQLGKRLGYVDATGAWALVPEHRPAGTLHRRFVDGLAAVRVGEAIGYMDRSGKIAIAPRFTRAQDFSEGLAFACDRAGCGYVDRAGRGVFGPGYMGGEPFREGVGVAYLAMGMGRARVELVRAGRGRLPGEFGGAGEVSEGLLAVKYRGAWGYVDRDGRAVIAPRFAWAGQFGGGLAPVRDEARRCGYVDRSGTTVIPFRHRSCGAFRGGLARVDLATDALEAPRVAFIDRGGKVVIAGATADPPFDSAEDFVDGLAAVGVGGDPKLAGSGPRLGYIDTAGRYVWKPTD